MKKTLAYAAAISLLLLSAPVRAQTTAVNHTPESLYFLNWEISKPTGGFADYIDEVSYRGFSFEGRRFLNPRFSLGLSFSWNRYNQTFDNASFDIDNGVITGPVYRDAEMFAIRAIGHFYLLPGAALRPYLGAGIGGSWDYAYQQSADLSRYQQNFDFIVSPELGLLWNVQQGWSTMGLNLAARYTYTTATVGSVKDTQALSLIVGVNFGY